MATLKAMWKGSDGRSYPVNEPTCHLGRNQDCHISDLFEGRATISRSHATIEKTEDGFLLRDLGSRNGTWVNNSRIAKPVRLQDGDHLTLGGLEFVFQDSAAARPFAFGEDAVDFTQFVESDDSSRIQSTIGVREAARRAEASSDVRLRAFARMLSNLGGSLEKEDVLDTILQSLLANFMQADRGFIGLRDSVDAPLKAEAVRHRIPDQELMVNVSSTIANQVMENKEAIRSTDARHDARFDTSESIADLPIRSVICAPLIGPDDTAFGILQLDTASRKRQFRDEDLDVLVAVAGLVSVAIQYARVHSEAVAWQIVRHDLYVARSIQATLLPAVTPDVTGHELYSHYSPAREVGGDYYDYIWLPDGRCAVIVADAESKGVSAALLMTVFSERLKCLLESGLAPAAAVTAANARLYDTEHMVTLVMAIIDPQSNEVAVLNAGHFAPLLRRKNGSLELPGTDSKGFPLGADRGSSYSVSTVKLESGDALVMFSDGFTDAANNDGKRFELPRLEQSVTTADAAGAKPLAEHVVKEVEQFIGEADQFDDMCLVCVYRR